jgi:hypothetical protein
MVEKLPQSEPERVLITVFDREKKPQFKRDGAASVNNRFS